MTGEARVNSIGIAKEMLEAQDSSRGETFYPDFLAVADSVGCRPALPAQLAQTTASEGGAITFSLRSL